MFQSDQLSNQQSTTLASLVILLVSGSLCYFAWVLFGELWVAFNPDTPLPWLGIKQTDESDVFDAAANPDKTSWRKTIQFQNQNPMNDASPLPQDEDRDRCR